MNIWIEKNIFNKRSYESPAEVSNNESIKKYLTQAYVCLVTLRSWSDSQDKELV